MKRRAAAIAAMLSPRHGLNAWFMPADFRPQVTRV
jgi:hypothetical protein